MTDKVKAIQELIGSIIEDMSFKERNDFLKPLHAHDRYIKPKELENIIGMAAKTIASKQTSEEFPIKILKTPGGSKYYSYQDGIAFRNKHVSKLPKSSKSIEIDIQSNIKNATNELVLNGFILPSDKNIVSEAHKMVNIEKAKRIIYSGEKYLRKWDEEVH